MERGRRYSERKISHLYTHYEMKCSKKFFSLSLLKVRDTPRPSEKVQKGGGMSFTLTSVKWRSYSEHLWSDIFLVEILSFQGIDFDCDKLVTFNCLQSRPTHRHRQVASILPASPMSQCRSCGLNQRIQAGFRLPPTKSWLLAWVGQTARLEQDPSPILWMPVLSCCSPPLLVISPLTSAIR